MTNNRRRFQFLSLTIAEVITLTLIAGLVVLLIYLIVI
jgi:hypothetical protein